MGAGSIRHFVLQELEAHLAAINDRDGMGFLRGLAERFRFLLDHLDPDSTNVGVLATAADPLHWGHVLMCFEAMQQCGLSRVYVLPQGGITYKPEHADRQVRHHIATAVLEPFRPLLEYTDAGLGNDRRGEENVRDLIWAAPDASWHYIIGAESPERAQACLDRLERHCGDVRPTLVYHRRNDCAVALRSSRVAVREFWIPRCLQVTSSRHYRAGRGWIAPRLVTELARDYALYGHPETPVTLARRAALAYLHTNAGSYLNQCFTHLRRGAVPAEPATRCWPQKRKVEVTAPVRLDIASGLGSDLLPISFEKGGTVLNAAITLGGRRPIAVTIERVESPSVTLRSEDLGVQAVIHGPDDLAIRHDDPLRLYRAAVVQAGLCPDAGVAITGRADVPMGSGLGASSILGAAILRGIRILCGQRPDALAPSSVALEWRAGNRGGWQDAIGGMLGGLKRICAGPGEEPVVERLTPSAGFLAQLRAHTVLFCGGVPRREGILDHVMTGYLVRDPTVYPAILEGRALTDQLSQALSEEDLESFGTLLGDYWEAWIRHAGPGAVTDTMQAVLEAARPFTLGAKVSGVGVFYLFVARPGMAESLRATLSGLAGGQVYDFDLDGEGARTREH